MTLPKHTRPQLIREDDGTLWEASWDEDNPMAGLFGGTKFLFREIQKNPDHHWWCFWRPSWVRTGLVWEGDDYHTAGFSIVGRKVKV